ncbi:enoyl-CoA hydratase/isomerase family protein [Oceaniglobus trochenteri]|uniref:enoyl-CoA hydratase/isomerase family protein n=1 Tax=Oceaniglobus trochenteri TaxID=2763260 RepID=UPI001D001658|nr:enoyl-CoA hydratase/isomerase family protein [Oceaniglobus trochenteri]
MSDVEIRTAGRAGRITLNRPKALNALTWDMVRAIDAALIGWARDDAVSMLILDGAGERAFCAGGDLAAIHAAASAGDHDHARGFWRDEYAMNARLFNYPKPVVSLLHGFTMGGGVGVGCHASHRIVGESSRISLPECAIGLVPDVGGSLLLARAPGRLGEYLGTTGRRMRAGDAILAGFADHYLAESDWPALIEALERTGDPALIDAAAQPPAPSELAGLTDEIDRFFGARTLADLLNALGASETAFARQTLGELERVSPLSAASTLDLVRRVRGLDGIEQALRMEYRFTARAQAEGDFLEGIRAAIIDKDDAPRWRQGVKGIEAQARAMLQPLGDDELKLDEGPARGSGR